MTYTLRVNGIPAPQGSKKHIGRGRLIEVSKKVAPWRAAVAATAADAGINELHLDQAALVGVFFFMPRPKSHRGARGLRPSAPVAPLVPPDLDKLIRSTLDGLVQGGVLADDARITHLLSSKQYADAVEPGALIYIHPIKEKTP